MSTSSVITEGFSRPGTASSSVSARAPVHGLLVGGGDDVDHAAAPAVGVRAAQPLHVDLLAGDTADDLRAGHEDPAGRTHDHDVGQRRAVGRPAGRGTEHHRDLRYPPGRPHHRGEHLPDGVECFHPFGQPGPAAVPQPDDRHAFTDGGVDRVDDAPAALQAHRAAHDGGVGGVGDHRTALDRAAGGEHPAAVVLGQEGHRVGVEQRGEPHLGIPDVASLLGGRGGRESGHRMLPSRVGDRSARGHGMAG